MQKIISFIGSLAGAIPLVGLPSNPVIRVLVEAGIIMGAAGVIYALHYSIYGMIMQTNPPSGAEILPWVAMLVPIASYVTLRLAGILWKTQGRWSSKSSRITTFAIVLVVGLVLTIVAYPYPAEPDQSQVYSSSGNVLEEHTEPNSAEPSRHSLVIRSETTGDVWVIEAERKDDSWELDVKRDTMYLASATIIGLATFGSLVSVRVLGDPITLKLRTQGFFMMYIGVIVVIICQFFLMYGACCGNISMIGFIGYFGVTVAALLSITIGAAQILALWLKDSSNKGK